MKDRILTMIKDLFYFFTRLKARSLGNTIKKHTRINKNVKLRRVSAGYYSYIAENCSIADCEIGNYVSIGPSSVIGGADHRLSELSTSFSLKTVDIKDGKYSSVKIGHDVWLGSGVSVQRGVTIGQGAIIGANSVVTSDVDPYTVNVGAPCRKIKDRFIDTSLGDALIKDGIFDDHCAASVKRKLKLFRSSEIE